MTAETQDSELTHTAGTLRDALIAMGRLTAEDALRIDDVMRTTNCGFGDAAIQLGLITAEDIEEAINATRQAAPKSGDGVILGAFRKRPLSRNLPVKYVRTVKAGPDLTLVRDPDGPYSEQIRALRTELLLNDASNHGILIAVLSPCRGEGRTQLCSELAIAFSQLGQRTLLVDADLRRPRIHELFESSNSVGLAQALAAASAPEMVAVEGLPSLSVLISGANVPNPLELLTNGNFQFQLADLRKQYNIIVMDTPPVSEFADGLAIASCAEQIVIVSRSGFTPHRDMKEALRRLGNTQTRIVGAVVNAF